MRKLMWFSLGFAATCALGAYVLLGNSLLFIGVGLLVLSLIGLVFLRNDVWKRALLALLGSALGLLWFQIYDIAYVSSARAMDGQTVVTSVRTEDYSFDNGYGTCVDGQITLENRAYRVRVYLSSEDVITPGSMIHGEFRLRFTLPGGQKEATYHRSQGIFLVAYETGDFTVVPTAVKSWRYAPAYLRNEILLFLDQVFSEKAAPFAKALLIGDTTDLDYSTQTHLMLSGIRHVAAVSGLHVSILFSMIYLLSGKKRLFTALIGLPSLLLFAAVAGFTPSIMRACMMQALMILAMVFNREYDPPTALAFAVVIMLAMNPHCVTSVGFQLSVASVAGIFLFASKIHNRIMSFGNLSKVKRKSWRGKLLWSTVASVSVSLSATVLTAPLTAIYFGSVSLIGMLTNLLCLWAVNILFCALVAVCLIGLISVSAARLVCKPLEWLIGYIMGVSSLLARAPLAAVFTDSIYILIWLVFCYVLLTTFLVMKNKRPLVPMCCAVVGLCVALLASWSEPLTDDYRVTALDVGQGQCIILQNRRKTYLVDCGGDRDDEAADKAAAYLQSQGIYRVDGLILTHYDKDHAGGVAYLLQRIDAQVLILPEQDDQGMRASIEKQHTGKTVIAKNDMSITWDGGSITVFASDNKDLGNESSLCVLFQTEKCDILITGDRSISGEVALLQSHILPDIEILVAGHHGAKSSTGEVLLNAIKPEIVLISVSQNNKFGHPSGETLLRLKQYGCIVRRTDLEGTIIIRG